MEKELILKI